MITTRAPDGANKYLYFFFEQEVLENGPGIQPFLAEWGSGSGTVAFQVDRHFLREKTQKN